MKRATQIIVTAVAAVCAAAMTNAGTFEEIKTEVKNAPKAYLYSGTVSEGDADMLQRLIGANSKLIIVISSGGGSFIEGIKLGELTWANKSKVDVIVDKAFSAAGLWALGDDNTKFLEESSMIGLHFAYTEDGTVNLAGEQVCGFLIGRYLEEVSGSLEFACSMMIKMAEAKRFGSQGMVVLSPKLKSWTVVGPNP